MITSATTERVWRHKVKKNKEEYISLGHYAVIIFRGVALETRMALNCSINGHLTNPLLYMGPEAGVCQ